MGVGGVAMLDHLAAQWGATPLARIDPDEFFDFSVQRPQRRLVDGKPAIAWPELQLLHARPEGATRDVLLLVGAEPHLRWPTLAKAFAQVITGLGCREAVQVLSFNGAVPHTRPALIQVLDGPPALAERFGSVARPSEYEGPVGFGSVLGDALAERGVATATLLSVSPFYLGLDPAPHAGVAIIRAIDRAVGTMTDVEELEKQQALLDARALDGLARSEDFRTLLGNLEQQYDSQLKVLQSGTPAELDGAAIVSDLDAFFRGESPPIEGPPSP
jgi:hypothetical protein